MSAQKPNVRLPAFTEVELTPQQAKWWTNTKTMFMWQAPGFAHVLISMLNPRGDENMLYWTKDIPTLATDGEIVMANPDFFFGLELPERTAALGHEVIHGILDHCQAGWSCKEQDEVILSNGKKLDYDAEDANIAQDYIVNDFLHNSRIGRLGKGWLHDPKIGTENDHWYDVYAKVHKKKPKGKNGPGQGNTPGRFDQHLAPGAGHGTPAPQAAQQRQQKAQAWKNAMAQAAAITKEALGQGSGSANQSKFFEQFLEPYVPWSEQIFGEFARKVGNGGWDFRRPDRRMLVRGIFAPGRSGHGCDTVLVFFDSSGSIYAVPKLIDRFISEVGGILGDLKPRRIIVVWCDHDIKRVDVIEDAMDLAECRHKGAAGGGGTRFEPPFEWVKEQGFENIDAAVYLTDLEGSFPTEEPEYPVIWCSIADHPVPWGTRILIPNDGSA